MWISWKSLLDGLLSDDESENDGEILEDDEAGEEVQDDFDYDNLDSVALEEDSELENDEFDAQMFGGINESDSDINEMDEDGSIKSNVGKGDKAGKGKEKGRGDSFVDAEEFAHLLEQSGTDGINKYQANWEERTHFKRRNKRIHFHSRRFSYVPSFL